MTQGQAFQDRIVEFTRMPAGDLLDHAGNWRTHPVIQQEGVRGVLESIGIVDVLLAYYSEREDGKLVLINGHLRKNLDPAQEWPVVIVNLDDEEADQILVTHDPLSAMAGTDPEKLKELLEETAGMASNMGVHEVHRQLRESVKDLLEEQDEKAREEEQAAESKEIPEMDIQPFEHHDFLMLVFDNSLDWEAAIEFFGLGKVRYTAASSTGTTKQKIGAGRVLDGSKALQLLLAQANAQAGAQGASE